MEQTFLRVDREGFINGSKLREGVLVTRMESGKISLARNKGKTVIHEKLTKDATSKHTKNAHTMESALSQEYISK